jgi:hypothetical protein
MRRLRHGKSWRNKLRRHELSSTDLNGFLRQTSIDNDIDVFCSMTI